MLRNERHRNLDCAVILICDFDWNRVSRRACLPLAACYVTHFFCCWRSFNRLRFLRVCMVHMGNNKIIRSGLRNLQLIFLFVFPLHCFALVKQNRQFDSFKLIFPFIFQFILRRKLSIECGKYSYALNNNNSFV